MLMQHLCDLATSADCVKLHVMQVKGTDQFQVVVQPSLDLSAKFPALSQPLLVTETREKIGAEVISALTEFTPMHKAATTNLASVQSSLDAAVKAAHEKSAAKKPTAPPKTSATGSNTANGVTPTQPMQKTDTKTGELFGNSGETPPGQTDGESSSAGGTASDFTLDLPEM